MWTDGNGRFCDGDMPTGWRRATEQEQAANKSERDAVVPPAVRSGQLVLALHELGFLDAVEAAVASEHTPRLAKVLWAKASQFDRDNDFLVLAARAAGMTDADVDAVFRLAATK